MSSPVPVAAEGEWRAVAASRSLRRTLSAYRIGAGDRTTQLSARSFTHATLTPHGPGTMHLTWTDDPAPVADCGLDARAWGPGASWLLDRVDAITGTADHPIEFADAHPVVARALALTRTARIGASHNLYHLLVPMIIGQRITAGEAIRQWHRLVDALGEPAPGPPDIVDRLRLPPSPDALCRRPPWWFHPFGIEAKRARAISEVARHAGKFWGWADQGPGVAAQKLQLIPGVGPWTIGSVLGPALGDPDAVAVGDFHFANIVAWALAGEPRATDERMLELLAPYRGQRGRVLHALTTTSGPAPAFGPRQRIVPIARL